jgi:hypothetical protein
MVVFVTGRYNKGFTVNTDTYRLYTRYMCMYTYCCYSGYFSTLKNPLYVRDFSTVIM